MFNDSVYNVIRYYVLGKAKKFLEDQSTVPDLVELKMNTYKTRVPGSIHSVEGVYIVIGMPEEELPQNFHKSYREITWCTVPDGDSSVWNPEDALPMYVQCKNLTSAEKTKESEGAFYVTVASCCTSLLRQLEKDLTLSYFAG